MRPPGGLLYVGNHQKSSRLYQSNLAGTYTRLPNNGAWPLATPSTVTDRHGCAWADFDHNGLMDMANSAGRNQSNFVKPTTRDNELWLQTSLNHFTEVGTQVGIADPCGRGRHEAAADFNGDGWADLVVGNAIPRNVTDPCSNPANGYPSKNPKIYYNLGDPEGNGWNGFAKGIDLANADDPGQRCMEAVDLNRDGHMDLVACRLKNKPPEAFMNDGTGKLVLRSGTLSGLTSAVSDAAPYDIDGDGDLDLAQIRKTSCGYQLNDGTGRFGTYRSVLTFSNEGRAVAIGQTQAGLAIYCQVQADHSNPTDYVGVLSGTTWAKYPVPGQVASQMRSTPCTRTVPQALSSSSSSTAVMASLAELGRCS